MADKLLKQLKGLGSKLKVPPPSKDALLKLLKQSAKYLSELEQSPTAAVLESLQPFFSVMAKPELLKHQDRDVKLLVATCICEIMRISAPEAPYSESILREIFALIVGTFRGLSDASSPSFARRVVILETLARYRSCLVMLDLECYDLIKEMFSIFFSVIRDDHPQNVKISMETIMVVLIEESEEIPEDILLVILSNLGHDKKDMNSSSRKLALNVIKSTEGKLEPEVKQFLISAISGNRNSSDNDVDYHEVIYDIYCCAPGILLGVIPYLTRELLAEQVDVQLKAVKLVGDLFAMPGSSIPMDFQPLLAEFLNRLTDTVAEVRIAVLEHIRICLLSNPLKPEASRILSALQDGLLDLDEHVREKVVSVICDMACHDLRSVPVEAFKQVAERLHDNSVLVRKSTMERLAVIYRLYCSKVSDHSLNNEFDWIPGKILRCYYDKDFRSTAIEYILSVSMFPSEFSTKNKVKHWVRVFAEFGKHEVKALEKMLEQKQRLQQEMQKYLSLRENSQSEDASEYQKKVLLCFKVMTRLLPEDPKTEELFQYLDQIKEEHIWRILTTLLDSDTSSHQACALQGDLLKILGEDHDLYNFLNVLSLKISYLPFDNEHVQELLLEATVQKISGNTDCILSCMSILAIIARYCPALFIGTDNDLMSLLKDDNEIIREGILHILAKAGGTIKEQLGLSSSSIDLTLETLCLEGSRKQAKHAVHALAAITKDDGLMKLSVLYKRLVDMLVEETHLPAVLQSLGCIAQSAISVFETRETEIIEFIRTKILNCSSRVEDIGRTSWDGRSELCSLKIYAIKALVKSYLPVKDAYLRTGVNALIEILTNVLLYGEVSKEITSSMVDKAHLKLASAKAILRLSRCWDHKIPVDVFHLTIRSSEVNFPEVKKLFLGKVHQYLRDGVLDGKYACAFVTNMAEFGTSEFEEDKQNLRDIIQMYYQTKTRQLATPTDTSSAVSCSDCLLPYLIHVLAHYSLPNIDECKDLKAYEHTYRMLYLIISLLVKADEDSELTSIEKENDRITTIASILLCIKSCEDVVDPVKSKNSHAICDLGISILKRLAQKKDIFSDAMPLVTVPSVLYNPIAKSEENRNECEERTWLADESSVAHFLSLKLVTNEVGDPEEEKDNEKNNQIPLRKRVKGLKSRGSKGKRARKKVPPAKNKSTEQDNNIAREINLENLELPSNGRGLSPIGTKKVDRSSNKRVLSNGIDATPIPIPKRRRSFVSAVGQSSSSKHSARGWKENLLVDTMDSGKHSGSRVNLSSRTSKVDGPESDLLVSSLKMKIKGRASEQKSKTSRSFSGGRTVQKADKDDMKMSDIDVVDEGNAKTPIGSSKKRKRRSVAVLAKCAKKEREIQPPDLVGRRIKVWWPLDRKFYEGVVKSYKKITNEYGVTYDDGDVELLSLDNERWELVGRAAKSVKKTNWSKEPTPSKGSSNYKSSSKSKGKKIKTSSSIVLGLRAPAKKTRIEQHKKLKGSKSEFVNSDVEEQLNEPNGEPSKSSHSNDAYNDDSKNDEVDKMQEDEEVVIELAENNAEVASEAKQVTEDPGTTTEAEELMKANDEVNENIATASQDALEEDAKNSDQGEKKFSKSPKLDKPGNEASTLSEGAIVVEEDEPLSLWKQRATKKSN